MTRLEPGGHSFTGPNPFAEQAKKTNCTVKGVHGISQYYRQNNNQIYMRTDVYSSMHQRYLHVKTIHDIIRQPITNQIVYCIYM